MTGPPTASASSSPGTKRVKLNNDDNDDDADDEKTVVVAVVVDEHMVPINESEDTKRTSSTHNNNNHHNEANAATEAEEAMVDVAWDHYRNYLDSEGQDSDELQELLDVLRPITTTATTTTDATNDDGTTTTTTLCWNSRHDLVPILRSVVYYHFAEEAITQYVQQQQEEPPSHPPSDYRSYHRSDRRRQQWQQQQRTLAQTIQHWLGHSLRAFPYNANTWSMGANFGRLSNSFLDEEEIARQWYAQAVSSSLVLRQYALAVVDEETEKENDEETEDAVANERNEWIELLVLNQILGMEYIGTANSNTSDEEEEEARIPPSDEEEETTETTTTNERRHGRPSADAPQRKTTEEEEEEEEAEEAATEPEHDGSEYSPSAVEGTARFMCGMLCSMAQQHTRAFHYLQPYFQLTHRLHPNVWQQHQQQPQQQHTPARVTTALQTNSRPPCVFGRSQAVAYSAMEEDGTIPTTTTSSSSSTKSGILPHHLYTKLVHVFRPEAPYWKESKYAMRGYYSFFQTLIETQQPLPSPSPSPDASKCCSGIQNLIEDVVINHLLPRANQCLEAMLLAQEEKEDAQQPRRSTTDKHKTQPKICGYEWWTHTRPIQANLGHNLHYDTDESLLEQDGTVTHPILSSVLYLTTGSNTATETTPTAAGATIVFEETPESTTIGKTCWQCLPQDNTFMVFPGNKLHGVLPCPGGRGTTSSSSSSSPSPSPSPSFAVSRTVRHHNDEQEHKDVDDNAEDDKLDNNNVQKLIHDCWKKSITDTTTTIQMQDEDEKEDPQQHRLTFMVGFWTRDVPAKMKHRVLYGPCGPLPPTKTKDHTWVDEITQGYNRNTMNANTPPNETPTNTNATAAPAIMTAVPLPQVSPAWEFIGETIIKEQEDDNEDTGANDVNIRRHPPHPIIPPGIDHRFFVRDAPNCFRRSLFEDRPPMTMTEEEDEDLQDEN